MQNGPLRKSLKPKDIASKSVETKKFLTKPKVTQSWGRGDIITLVHELEKINIEGLLANSSGTTQIIA